jgi:hypothetical protein
VSLAKAKSWELRFYRKARRKASKKLTDFEPGFYGWIGFSEDDDETIAEGANIRRQSRIYFANALRTTRSTGVLALFPTTRPTN